MSRKLTSKVVSAGVLALLLTTAVVGVVASSGCGSSSSKSKATNASATGSSVENVSLEVLNGERAKTLGHLGPDGKGHDMYLPSDFNVKVGEKVTVTVTNYDEGPHTFTSPDIGVNATIAPAIDAKKGIPSKTTFTFTVHKAGKYRWYCMVPCDGKQQGWAMTPTGSEPGQDKYMAGYVVAA